jgi:hypothetical protein
VPAESDEVAWICSQCGQGLALDEDQGLVPLEVQTSADLPPNTTGRPFWVARGQVDLQARETYGSGGKARSEADRFWSEGRLFFIPAFACPLEERLSLSIRLLTQPPELRPGPPARFIPAILPASDVQAAAEFTIMAIEAGRSDKLKEVHFTLQLEPPALWILA